MEVAVARVEDIRHAQALLPRHLVDLPQHLRDLRARDDAVLNEVVRADTPDRGECALSPLPHQRPFRLVARAADLQRTGGASERDGVLRRVFDLRLRAVGIHQERRADIRPVQAGRGLRGHDREAVHHLDRGRHDPRRDDRRDRVARLCRRREGREERAGRFRLAQDSQDDLGDDAHHSLAPHQDSQQIVSRRVEHRPAQIDDASVREHDPGAEHVIGREAVLETVGPARVLGHVAADRADALRRGVGRVVVA